MLFLRLAYRCAVVLVILTACAVLIFLRMTIVGISVVLFIVIVFVIHIKDSFHKIFLIYHFFVSMPYTLQTNCDAIVIQMCLFCELHKEIIKL